RRVQAGLITRLLQDSRQHVRCGAFAVGAGDMDRFETLLRIAQRFAKPVRVGKVFLEGRRAIARKHGQTPIEVINRFLVIHGRFPEGLVYMLYLFKPETERNQSALLAWCPFDLVETGIPYGALAFVP